MKGVDVAIKLAKEFEGCMLTSYWDKYGDCWSVGYGYTGDDIDARTIWTQKKAEARLVERMTLAAKALIKISPCLLNDTPERQGAMIDFVYNLGAGAYRGSTLRKCIDAGDWNNAAIEIVKWDHAGNKVLAGLTKRRIAEAKLLLLPE